MESVPPLSEQQLMDLDTRVQQDQLGEMRSKCNSSWQEPSPAVQPDRLGACRGPCPSVLVMETRTECDKEKLRRDKNEPGKGRLLLFCQGTKTRGSEKSQGGIIAMAPDKLINV